MLLEIIILGLGIVLGYVVGYFISFGKAMSYLLNNPDIYDQLRTPHKNKDQPGEGETREIKVEKIENTFFLYDKENGQFLAQAVTLEEALDRVEQRFPYQTFQGFISSEEAKKLGISSN